MPKSYKAKANYLLSVSTTTNIKFLTVEVLVVIIYQMLILLLKRILLKILLAIDMIKMERLYLNQKSAGIPFLSNFRL